jgi:membrane-associated phospholipid phosphatase
MSAISTTASAGRRDVAPALLLAGLCVAGLTLTWVLAALVPATHLRDAIVLHDFTRLDSPTVEGPANLLLELLEPPFFIMWGLVLVAIALSRARPRLAVTVALVMGLAPLSAELLKPLAAHTHVQMAPVYITSSSWPSGHATAVTVLVWCAVLVTPPARRRFVAIVGVLLAAAVGCSLLILAWHMPSDVLGGYLMGTLWAALAIAALRAVGPRRARPRELSQPYRPTRARVPLEPIATRIPPPLGSHSRRG